MLIQINREHTSQEFCNVFRVIYNLVKDSEFYAFFEKLYYTNVDYKES